MSPANEPPAESTPDLPSIGGEYRLLSKLGEGAYGEVYRCHHELLGQDFAVKLLKPELCEDKDIRDRFLDEARALIRFSHPNIVQVRHVGEYKGRLYLVMDLVKGTELSDLLKRGPMEEERALGMMRQILSGLEAAHAAGIVHRDLKPSNIIVEKRPDGRETVKILDFGLSKFSAVDGVKGAHRSITGTIVGTLAYMSPEQIKGESDIDGRSDLFAAGIIFMEMLQGHHPYPGESGIVVAAKLLRDPIPPLSAERARGVSDHTRSALSRALERDRDARFPSVTAFAQALEGRGPPSDTSRITTVLEAQAELARQEAAARKAAPPAAAAGKGKGKALDAAPGAAGATKRSPVPAIVALVILGVGAAAFFLLGKDDEPKTPRAGASTATRDPVRPTPTPLRQPVGPAGEPGTPPTQPDPPPAQPERPAQPPTQPDRPAQPPAQPERPAQPPTQLDIPAQPPTQPDRPTQPPDMPPAQPEVVPPPGGDPTLSPADCCGAAGPRLAAGDWAEARVLFQQAVASSEITSPTQVAALRGVAESYVAQADALARSGQVDAALALLGEALTWLQERHHAYEQVDRAVDTARLQLGFSRLHQAEAHMERGRWLALKGDAKAAEAEYKQAEVHYDFALQHLQRDGVRYWEFLIRRAEFYRLRGDTEKMMADVAHTTKTNNEEVPAHMWVAHATAARRLARAQAAQGGLAKALDWARAAAKIAEDGASWREADLSRQQWLDLARVLFVLGTLLPADEDPTAIHGKTRYWVEMAGQRKPSGALPADAAQAGLTIGRATERYLQGRVLRFRKQADEARAAFEEAAGLADEAIALRKAVAAGGGLLEDAFPYEVQASVRAALGQDEATKAAAAAARAADRANPD